MSECYQVAKGCSTGPQPGAAALMRAILEAFPTASNLGIFNCRKINRPGGSAQWSVHAEGRALDVRFPGSCHPEGWRLHRLLWDTHTRLGIQFIAWCRQKWGCSYGGPRPYGGYPHTDHLHIELNWAAARGLTYDEANRILRREDDDMTPEQDRILREVHRALYTSREGKVLEHPNVLESLLRRALERLEDIWKKVD